MKIVKSILLITPLLFTHTGFAGWPVKDTVKCPIGGKSFVVTNTASCSTMGRTLSMQPETSCDFITRLPQCPTSKLPMYKEFSETDLKEIEAFMQTDEYKTATEKSKYFLAYLVDNALSSKDTETQFFLLQQGYWYTADQSYNDKEYNTAYDAAYVIALPKIEENNQPFWRGAKVFNALWRKNTEKANIELKKLIKEDKGDNDFLSLYVKALSYCVDNMHDEELCSPTTNLRAHKEE